MRGRTTTLDDGRTDTEVGPHQGALEELYVRHAPEAARLAFLLTHDAAAAEDIAQEAFIKVAGRFHHLRSLGAFDAYLRRTVVNLCLSHHRKNVVARSYVEREHSRLRGEPIADPPDVESRDEVRSALAALPDRQRAAVVLRFYGDLSEQQVADALGCSVSAARSLVFRAMGTLRELIESEDR
jgi:RNA polymerase sigma-70 factor (sigma-E family)